MTIFLYVYSKGHTYVKLDFSRLILILCNNSLRGKSPVIPRVERRYQLSFDSISPRLEDERHGRRMFEGARRPISRLQRHPCRRFRHPVPVAIFMRRDRTGERWFHGIWKVSRAKTAGTHKEGWPRDDRRKGRKTVIVRGRRVEEKERGKEEESESEEGQNDTSSHPFEFGQTENHGVSFVSGRTWHSHEISPEMRRLLDRSGNANPGFLSPSWSRIFWENTRDKFPSETTYF